MRHAVHEVTVRTLIGSETNAEGHSTPIWQEERLRGCACTLGDQEALVAAQRGVRASIAVDLPPTTRVDLANEIVVAGTGRLGLDGRYLVREIRPSRALQRLLCARYDAAETASSAPTP